MNTVWEYVVRTTRKGETWHLMNSRERLIDSREPALTLCGQPIEGDCWTFGDETLSGTRTTCRQCLKGMNR
jgi:hypothetical protein